MSIWPTGDPSIGRAVATSNRALVDIVGLLLVVFLGVMILVVAGCGASAEEVRATACTATRYACRACSAAEAHYCGGEPVETEDNFSGGETTAGGYQ